MFFPSFPVLEPMHRNILLIIAFSGCITSPVDSTPDWTECRWSLPNGEPLDCEGDSFPLAATNRGPEWLCNFRIDYPDGYFSIVRSAITGNHAIEFDVHGKNLSGTALIQDAAGTSIYNWTHAREGILELGRELSPTGQLHFTLYESWMETNDPLLRNATLRQAIVWYDQEPLAIHHVQNDQHFLFHDYGLHGFGFDGFHTMTVERDGFKTTIFVDPALGGSFDFAVLGAPGPDCVNSATVPN